MGLAEQAAFLNSVLESSTEYSIVAKDLEGGILAWNEGARRIYGYEVADVIGKSAFLLHDPKDVKSGKAQQILGDFEYVLRALGLWDKRDVHPFRLSKGDRQRLAIASIAAMRPSWTRTSTARTASRSPLTSCAPAINSEFFCVCPRGSLRGVTTGVLMHAAGLRAGQRPRF